jgi:hypothetical protein
VRLRLLVVSLTAAALPLLFAVSAFASDNGEGTYGETDDRVVTAFGLGLVIFFTLAVIVLSAIQGTLDKRKDEKKKAAAMRQRAGW